MELKVKDGGIKRNEYQSKNWYYKKKGKNPSKDWTSTMLNRNLLYKYKNPKFIIIIFKFFQSKKWERILSS